MADLKEAPFWSIVLLVAATLFGMGYAMGYISAKEDAAVTTSEACAYLFAQTDTASVVKDHYRCLRWAWEETDG